MLDKVMDILKTKNLVIPGFIFFNKEKLGLNYDEMYILTYIYNLEDLQFDMVKISEDLKIKPKEILIIVNSLVEKNFIKLDTIKKDDYNCEYFNLDGLYNKVAFNLIGVEEKTSSEVVNDNTKKVTLFDEFENSFGRPLTAKEFQIINAWKEVGYSDELIILALNEAVYNGAYNIAYIDKVLSAWEEKGIKCKEDVEKNRQEYSKQESKYDDDLDDDYDWLNE